MDYAKYQKVKSNNCSGNIEELTNIDFIISGQVFNHEINKYRVINKMN
jgi:hypothetical protein